MAWTKFGAAWFAPISATLCCIALVPAGSAHAGENDVLVEFHYQPVADAQIAIWLEDTEGNFVQDVFVTQSTGTLGIGNRPGRWDFLSSWRFPYGERPQVLPIWAHARGRTYPKLRFFDDNPSDQDSLGWHENSSSPEPYYCRPLTQDEHDTISVDTMTCPSPSTFQSDKGRFDGDLTSVYPPRGDLISFEEMHDHPDAMTFAALNDLDAVSGATPIGSMPEVVTTIVAEDRAQAGLVAFIEVNLEYDENSSHNYDREGDHWVDPRLSGFGIEYFGQPSVLYRVEFDPLQMEFVGTDAYEGYGEWDGSTGMVYPPDETISTEGGSGADRLELHNKNGETFRFGAFSHGPGSGGGGTDSDSETDGGPGGGWGGCVIRPLPVMTAVELEPLEFNKVRVHFTVPPDTAENATQVKNVRLFYRVGDMPLSDDNSSSAIQQVPGPGDCGTTIVPGGRTYCDLNELFGATDYQIGIRYEDTCSNSSEIVAAAVTTPTQEFSTVDGFCFVATAAWGANWTEKVRALRHFRDVFLRPGIGSVIVAYYYYVGPPVAALIAKSSTARALARRFLGPYAELAVALTAAQSRVQNHP